MAERGAGRLDRWPEWMSALAFHVVGRYRRAPVDEPWELVAVVERFLAAHVGEPTVKLIDATLSRVPSHRPGRPPQPSRRLTRQAGAASGRARHAWPVEPIDSVPALAERLELSFGQLTWLADVRSLERTVAAEKLRNYRYRLLARSSGLPRVIEIPKARLKEVQRWVLHAVLDHIPAHDRAHGFAPGGSVISHARAHSGHELLLRLDLRDFFAQISAGRVFGIFRTAGYPPPVAHVLTGLVTNVVPQTVWQAYPRPATAELVQPRFWLGRALATPHLPQGAPSSPALANLAAHRLDRRLSGLAAALGLHYSRYADDLAFSGPRLSAAAVDGLLATAARIARAEGFSVNPAKSLTRTRAARQTVCGVVVNERPNVSRAEYEELKAILHNAIRHGPAGQNRAGHLDFRAHLHGRIAWVAALNPGRGEKLRHRFAQIDWESRQS